MHTVDTPGDTSTTTPPATLVPGLIRRARRAADLSQRALAARLGVSQSRVARWETGRTCPTVADLERVMTLAGMRLALLDDVDARVLPMREDAARDRASRRYPAHVDLTARGWWTPPGSHLTAEWWPHLQRSRETGDVRIAYDLGRWRDILRGIFGTQTDHPTHSELVRLARGREGSARESTG